ncbi:hypothetical protein PG985_011147 [Apiospora marii]|uniref:uncharacterized protein n=1 Tax=Apiospora marii TaxID=335849 RepID=UPI00313214BB
MKFTTAILLGAVAFVEAKPMSKPTVVTFEYALWYRFLMLTFAKVFSPERTGAATANDPNPTANSANASNLPIKGHGDAICPTTNDHGAWKKYIKDGVNFLRNFKGVCASAPLTTAVDCTRVSCSWASGIYLCNDSAGKWAMPPCSTIADYAEQIMNKCDWSVPDLLTSDKMCQGELWDDDDWHVYVGHAHC